MKFFSTIICCFTLAMIRAQPYIDIVSFEYIRSPDVEALRRNNTANSFSYYYASLNLPLVNKKDSSIILLSPFVERWNIKIHGLSDLPAFVQSLAFPVSFIKPLSRKLGISISAIPRWNGDKAAIFNNDFQLGGAVIINYKLRQNLTYKVGLYYNGELSGAYFVPLFGIDWRINKKNNLFGILPGNLVFEHKANTLFYWGGSFVAVTNTYKAGFVNNGVVPKYLRLEDNQLGIFADYYIQRNILLHLEAGHSLFRAFKLGLIGGATNYYYTTKMEDDVLLKVSLNYRFRF